MGQLDIFKPLMDYQSKLCVNNIFEKKKTFLAHYAPLEFIKFSIHPWFGRKWFEFGLPVGHVIIFKPPISCE